MTLARVWGNSIGRGNREAEKGGSPEMVAMEEARRERMMAWAALEGRRRGSGSNCPVASIFSFPLKLKFTL